ncbi:MAG: ABC transporter permease, partial [Paracoccus sp. (in: a-proteobacteria)]|nr:ABC transporter permease [Paracoccus sp. (in: a-proteobacteria)]
MFSYCSDPSQLEGLVWLSCYLSSGTHLLFYASFGTVFVLLALTAPLALALGYAGALASRSQVAPLRWFGKAYTSMVRGIPDILFFLFVPIALDQGLEWVRHQFLCDSGTPVRQGNDFVVCPAAKLPLSNAAEWVHNTYNLT